jgi:FlgD Ig-like domain
VTRRGRLLLGLLAVATVCAGVVVQRVKDAPALVRSVRVSAAFTPNGDGVRDRARIGFRSGRRDRASVTIVGAGGATVRRLATGRPVGPRRRLRLRWDGRTDAGTPAPPGAYRVRVTLPGRGSTLELATAIRLLDRAPRRRRG